MDKVITFLKSYFDWFYFPKIHVTDILEILIIAVVIYYIISWFKTTRAWTLFKGILVLLAFMTVASAFKLNTILWLLNKTISIGIIALLIIFQPELRRALERLGRNDWFTKLFGFVEQKDKNEVISDFVIDQIVKATFEMAKVKTGALMVIQKEVALGEYESTGIKIDAAVTTELLINIFEKNTPLHDGAVIIKDNRVDSATCYLPLSDNMQISKHMGTRHRAALGISEVSDSITIVVSEETGNVSIASGGVITRNMTETMLSTALHNLNRESAEANRFLNRKGRKKYERKASK